MSRSIKKGPFVQESLLKKIEAMNAADEKKVVKTWSIDENYKTAESREGRQGGKS